MTEPDAFKERLSDAKSIARDLMLQHLLAFPDDMDAERCELQRRMGTTGSVVLQDFQRLEFEVVEAIKRGMLAEREACAKIADLFRETTDRLGEASISNNIASAIRARKD